MQCIRFTRGLTISKLVQRLPIVIAEIVRQLLGEQFVEILSPSAPKKFSVAACFGVGPLNHLIDGCSIRPGIEERVHIRHGTVRIGYKVLVSYLEITNSWSLSPPPALIEGKLSALPLKPWKSVSFNELIDVVSHFSIGDQLFDGFHPASDK